MKRLFTLTLAVLALLGCRGALAGDGPSDFIRRAAPRPAVGQQRGTAARVTGMEDPDDPDAAAYIGQVIRFETTDLDGNPVKSEDLFRDNAITMVNLWGTWCPYCVDEMAELARIHTRIREKGCGVVGIERENAPIAEVEADARAIMAANGTNYPNVLMDMDCEILRAFLYYPTTVFVDRQGTILASPISGAEVNAYEATLDALLAERADATPDASATANGGSAYRVRVFDPDGNPVEGALVQLCDDTTCTFQPTNADGAAEFPVGEQKVYEVHMLSVPEGFREDATLYKTLDTYSDVNIILERAE